MLGQTSSLFLATAAAVQAVTFAVPASIRVRGLRSSPLEAAPIGISFEFFAFPSYFSNVTATIPCLSNWKELTGTWPPIRIGGTTQDRATFDPATSAYVVYSVANAADAPKTLTFGRRFMTLASSYGGSVVLGLNRGKNNLQNTIEAARAAVAEMGNRNLQAIELGNEPEYYPKDGQPIASGSWNERIDALSQDAWAVSVGRALGDRKNIIQAGNSNALPPTWGAATLIATGNTAAREYVNRYSHHNYPGGGVADLMSHSRTSRNVRQFDTDVAAALRVGKPYVMGETNSVSGGGAAGVSPTFGAGLWVMDYSLRLLSSNFSRVYFHHGTVGNCQYCWFGRYNMGAPYYGAYAATTFLSSGSYVAALDDGRSAFAAYATFDSSGSPLRLLLYNSNYFSGTSGASRPRESFTLTGLPDGPIRAKRLTAQSAMTRADRSSQMSFGGQGFANVTCAVVGRETFERATISGGRVTLNVGAGEALVVYLR